MMTKELDKKKQWQKRKKRNCLTKRTVLKMLAVMESSTSTNTNTSTVSTQDPVSEFLVTGRTGRRNAMADILGPHATTTSADLPERLEALTTGDTDAGPSSDNQSSSSMNTMGTNMTSEGGGTKS